jgi:DNA-binding transcriptional LysR family regulator
MRMDIEISQLRRFLAIVECGTFVDAAAMLNISQQGLSSSIAKMEELAGVRVFDRTRGGRLTLTVFGRLLLTRGRAQLVMADRMMSELRLLRDARGGSVTVGISETMTGRHVATAIRRYHRQQPDVQIRLLEGYTGVMIERMLAGEVDFVVGSPTADPERGGELGFRHLFEIRDVLAVRPAHPLSGRRQLRLEELCDYTWMVPAFRGDVYEAIQLAYMRAKLPGPRHIIRSDAVVVGTWLCLDDDYIITVSPDMIGAMVELGGLVVLDLEDTTIVRHACAITRVDVKLSGSASRLLEEIVFEAERSHGTMAG